MERQATRLIVVAFVLILSGSSNALDNSEIAAQCQDAEYLMELFTVGGRPVNEDPNHKVKILINHGYAVGYSEKRRNPLWAVYKASDLQTGTTHRYRRSQLFPRDLRVVPSVDGRTFGGGYDRGHMVPNAAIGNQYGSLAQMETFLMTNMCPQKGDLNQHPWKHLEQWVTDAAEARQHIYVIAGPIFADDPDITQNGPERGIQIPDEFYMILVDLSYEWNPKPTVKMIAYRFPQSTPTNADFKNRQQYGASVDEIEDATNLDFFPLYAEMFTNWATKEAEVVTPHWSLN